MMDAALKSIVFEAVREALEHERPALVAQLRAELRAETGTPDPWLPVTKAAERAGVTPDTIREWCTEGLKHGRAGRALRIRQSELDAWIAKRPRADLTVVDISARVEQMLGKLGGRR